ncbi:hypothetical protein [Gimesia aquarii]|uniref:Uncharacterized protein n=1 Tax=Gimesia aquarii TaxID=2527964 RepID=A0A517VP52_9PLAN|nr:hypothetical protein [Gimesia aquarii]QDT94753.1 hypothetical protein V144x_01840 [Gimesia aquarii]
MTKLFYGDYSHDENECNVSISRQGLIADDGFVYGFTERWQVTGILHGDTNTDLIKAMKGLEAAYAVQGKDLIFLKGQDPMHSLIDDLSLSGTRVTALPQFSVSGNGELTTFRTYSLVVEADYALSNMTYRLADGANPEDDNSEIIILKYEESIDFTGTGGPRFGFLPTLKGAYQRQQLSEKSLVEATQTGMAVGLGKRPLLPDPLWPLDEHLERRIVRKPQPRKRGGYQIEYPIHWSYTFERNDVFPVPKQQ